jgi:hypothetical protein
MTIAVVWEEDRGLWGVADTRISAEGTTTPTQRVTDHGSKLFPLGITVWEPGPSGFFDVVKLQSSIGYMYAGESGPALATYSLCSAVLQSLQVTSGRVPSLGDIARFIAARAQHFMRDWAERWTTHWRFTALIFGWCNVNSRFETYKLSAEVRNRIVVVSECVDTTAPIVIGSGAEKFSKELERLRHQGDEFGRKARLPLLAVERLVARGVQDDVGGDVQIARVTPIGLQILSRVHPEIPGQPKAKITFLGIDTSELGDVGPCRIGLTSLA